MSLVVLGLLLAVVYCVPPGPIAAEAFRQGIRHGWSGAFGVELGSVLGDAAYGGLAWAGLSALVRLDAARLVLGILGTVLLLYLAWQAYDQSRRPFVLSADPGSRRTFWSAFGVGAAMSLANPMGLPVMMSFGSLAAALHLSYPRPGQLWIFFASYVAGSILWAVLASLSLTLLKRRLTPRLFQTLSWVSALALAGFGLALGYQLLV